MWQKADIFTLLVELYKLIFDEGIELSAKSTARRLKQFYTRVDNFQPDADGSNRSEIARYHRAALQASNDRSNRVVRGEIISALMAK